MKHDRFTGEEREACVLRIRGGESVKAVARDLGVTEQTVYRWLKKYDGTLESLVSGSSVPHSPHPNAMPKDEEARLIAIVTQNPHITDKKLSELLGTNRAPSVLYRKREKLFGERRLLPFKYEYATIFHADAVDEINHADFEQGTVPSEFFVIEVMDGLYLPINEGRYPVSLTPFFTVALKFGEETEACAFCSTFLSDGMRWTPRVRRVKDGALR